MTVRSLGLAWAACLLVLSPAYAARLPDWVEAATAIPSPAPTREVHRHRLFVEHQVVVPLHGRRVIRERFVERILDEAGANEVSLYLHYDAKSSRVRALTAWIRSPDGREHRTLGANEWLDAQWLEWGTLRSDLRFRRLRPSGLERGSILAWETVVEEEPLLASLEFRLGARQPTALERVQLVLPEGIEPRVRIQGAGLGPAQHDGERWTWELRDRAALQSEPWSATSVDPEDRLAVDVVPVTITPAHLGVSFADWTSTSRWLDSLTREVRPASSLLRERALAVTRSLQDPVARARALARETQAVNYVSTSVGLARGEGYRPHAAEEVLRSGYGDCKDQANLFCALAREAGLTAWLASATTEGRDHIDTSWSTPGQFNHCIAAVALPDTGLPATAQTTLGRLTFFDPTDPYTPFGSLPPWLEGSQVLLIAPRDGELVRLPVAGAGHDHEEWRIEGTVERSGRLQANIRVHAHGASARELRSTYRAHGPAEFRSRLESALHEWASGGRIRTLAAHDEADSDRFEYDATLVAEHFVHPLPDGRVPVPGFPWPIETSWPTSTQERRSPIALPSHAFEAWIQVALPEGWRVQATPPPAAEAPAFGRWSLEWQGDTGLVRQRLSMRLDPVTLAADRERDVRRFLSGARRAARAHLLLATP